MTLQTPWRGIISTSTFPLRPGRFCTRGAFKGLFRRAPMPIDGAAPGSDYFIGPGARPRLHLVHIRHSRSRESKSRNSFNSINRAGIKQAVAK